jgi:hypothetical protein
MAFKIAWPIECKPGCRHKRNLKLRTYVATDQFGVLRDYHALMSSIHALIGQLSKVSILYWSYSTSKLIVSAGQL